MYRKVNNKEYEITIDGRTKTIMIPFGKTELIFKEFIAHGGVIDPATGEVQTDILSLIASFRSVGDILLTEYDEVGKVAKEGTCADLDATEVIANFIRGLEAMQKQPEIQNPQKEEGKPTKRG
jgi:hypothetical protein